MVKSIIRASFGPHTPQLAMIDLGVDRVPGSVRGNVGRLDSVPLPTTNYHFLDEVQLDGPTGSIEHKDKKIPLYRAVGPVNGSGLFTFTFEVVLQSREDWDDLSRLFDQRNLNVRIAFDYGKKWQRGHCAAKSYADAERILQLFVASHTARMVRDIVDCTNGRLVREGEIGVDEATMELRYPKGYATGGAIVGIVPALLFFAVTFKTGIHSLSELSLFFSIVIASVVLSLILYRVHTIKINVDQAGISTESLFGKSRQIKWSEISSVRYNKGKPGLEFRSMRGEKITVRRSIWEFWRFCQIASNRVESVFSAEIAQASTR